MPIQPLPKPVYKPSEYVYKPADRVAAKLGHLKPYFIDKPADRGAAKFGKPASATASECWAVLVPGSGPMLPMQPLPSSLYKRTAYRRHTYRHPAYTNPCSEMPLKPDPIGEAMTTSGGNKLFLETIAKDVSDANNKN